MSFTTSSARLGEGVLRAQMHWQERQRDEAANKSGPAPAAFTIAISREAGANGTAIADKLAARLHWPVYDRELLRHVAEEMGLNARLIESVDEKRTNWLTSFFETFATSNSVSEGAYLYNLAKVVLSLAAHGECVMVGRGVCQFLPADKTLRVRLVAPLADRIAVMQQSTGLGHEEAVRRVEKTDRDRTEFVREHFHKDVADPASYDLVLNTARFSIEECAELIEQALRRFESRKPKGAQSAALAG